MGKSRRVSLLGGAKKLTDHVIDKLSSYYCAAIRKTVHTSVREMQQGIWQSFFHLSAKDVRQHTLCPPGEESWWFVQRAKAQGKEPEPHSTKMLYLSNIPEEQLELVKGVYRDLANPALLQKCLSGRTQNPNESLHSKVWRKVSKDKYAGLHRVRFVSQMTIWEHNFGYSESNLLKSIGFGVSSHSTEVQERRDKERKRHQTPRSKKKTKAEEDTQQETQTGRKRKRLTDASYQAGAH